jgi:hypothetical protein
MLLSIGSMARFWVTKAGVDPQVWSGWRFLCLFLVFGVVVMFLIFRACGYARFIHCETSYDTPEARYRPFVYSFIYDSNVEFRTSKKGISQASNHNTEGDL